MHSDFQSQMRYPNQTNHDTSPKIFDACLRQNGNRYLASRTIDIRPSGNAAHVTMSTWLLVLQKFACFFFATILVFFDP